MPQQNDLSRSLIPVEQASTLVAVIELSQSSWLIAGTIPGIERQPLKKIVTGRNGTAASAASDGYLASTRARDKGSAGRPPARFSRDLLCLAVSDRGVEDTLPADRAGPAWVRRDGQGAHRARMILLASRAAMMPATIGCPRSVLQAHRTAASRS